MTKRQANMLTWLVLLPLTIAVWAQPAALRFRLR
jgi:hypothetical protein